MRSYPFGPFDSGDLPSLQLARASNSNEGAIEVISVEKKKKKQNAAASSSLRPEMSDAMMLLRPAVVEEDGSVSSSGSTTMSSKQQKTWDELAAVVAGPTLVSPSSASSVASDLSVAESPFLEALDLLVAGKNPREEQQFLREMVVDLMTEVDALKEDLKTTKAASSSQQQGGINLFQMLSSAIEAKSSPLAAAKKAVAETIKKREQPATDEEVNQMVIQQLTKKIEDQNVRNTDYVAQIKKLNKQLDIFKTACRARGKQIQNLKTQLADKNTAYEKLLASTKENNLSNNSNSKPLVSLPVRTITSPSPSKSSFAVMNKTNKIMTSKMAAVNNISY